MHLVGRLNASLIIKNILGALGVYNHPSNLIDTNASVNFYWNKGKPYLCDLVWYYNVAEELHMDKGGLGFDYLSDCWEALDNHDCIENEAPWTDEHGNIHKLLLLARDPWYRRKFNDIGSLRLKNPSFVTPSGKPRKVTTPKIRSICYDKEDI
jgi:hypothetical protein